MGIQTENMSFWPDIPDIPGLSYQPDYVDAAQETALVEAIDSHAWRHDLKRRLQHYGYVYDYRARAISADMKLGPLPDWLARPAQGLKEAGLFDRLPDQVIINEYQPGQGITPHIDCIPCFGPTIAIISLRASIDMDFTCGKIKQTLRLTPCSLLSLSGEARYHWKHAIAPRKSDMVPNTKNGERIPRTRRISLTFRTVRIN